MKNFELIDRDEALKAKWEETGIIMQGRKYNEKLGECDCQDAFTCDFCGYQVFVKSNYCPHCGAYMVEQNAREKDQPERLTIREWPNLDPWETCGDLTATCNRGNCRGCIVPTLYARLAEYEDEQEKGAKE